MQAVVVGLYGGMQFHTVQLQRRSGVYYITLIIVRER